MKFCPNCGKKREQEEECSCGYNYSTGNIKEQPINSFSGIKNMNEHSGIEPFQGAVPLEELKRRKLDIGYLLSVAYTSSGGMMGSYYHDELSFETNELTITRQEWHHGERKEIKYKTDKNEVEKIKKFIIENNFSAWSEIPVDRSMIAYDAPTSSMSLRFEQQTVSFSTLIYMDKEENEIFFKLREMINSLIIKENIIAEKIITPGQELNMMGINMTNSSGFCPECARPLVNNKCECGYEKK